MRGLTLVAGIVAALVVLFGLTVEEAEVVTLTTTDARGRQTKTGLWIVDTEDASYLRAASPEVGWLTHIRSDPRILITRQGETRSARAVPVDDPAVSAAVGRAMSRKYGSVDRVMAWLFDYTRSVPIRLEGFDPAPHGVNGSPPDGH